MIERFMDILGLLAIPTEVGLGIWVIILGNIGLGIGIFLCVSIAIIALIGSRNKRGNNE